MTGIEYPTITVGEHTLTVRMSLAAQVLMRRRGLDPFNIARLTFPYLVTPAGIPTTERNPDAERNVLIVFGCMVAENFIDPKNPRVDLDVAPSTDYWTIRIEELAPIEKVIAEALGKAAEQRQARLAVVAPTQAAS